MLPPIIPDSGIFVLSFALWEFVPPDVFGGWLGSGIIRAKGWSVTGSPFKCFSERQFFSTDFGSLLFVMLVSNPCKTNKEK